jgi:post-segregation antitoxin (ccd killing protein)
MSVVKLLSRLVAPDVDADTEDSHDRLVHDHTYGITSDPLTSFTVVLAALLHDVDHQGVPNSQLVNEGTAVAKVYQGRSVAEQNSFSVAWSLLMEDSYTELRHTIYVNSTEFQRFKQISINSILATDIMDKELGALRKDRWNAAFAEQSSDNQAPGVNHKASIVIEHLIQASDVAHTMQHWQIYRKWNERFFDECYAAYRAGRADKNPADVWYKGELGFFDYYVIPLAKKLGSCGVFGVSCDEYLNYAQQNRKEWASKGQEIVASMVERVREQEQAS